MNLIDVKITAEDLQNAMVMLGRIDDSIMMGEDVTEERIQELILTAITSKLIRRNPPGFKLNLLEVRGKVHGEPFGIKIEGDLRAELIREEKKK